MPDPSLQARAYEPEDADAWDAFAAESWNATFLHSRRFLSYHGSRFDDASVLVQRASGELVGLLPAARSPADDSVVVSHPGATFGGLVHAGGLLGEQCIEAFELIMRHYRACGFRTIEYKVVPLMYQRKPAQDDLYALFRLGAERYRVDLASTIDLVAKPELSKGRRSDVKKALRAGVVFEQGEHLLGQMWPLITETLADRHSTHPVHTLDEIQLLAGLFPDAIRCVVARTGQDPVAAAVLFVDPVVTHCQYLAANDAGRRIGALSALIAHGIEAAVAAGARYFDLGTSNEDEGQVLNVALHDYKRHFGAGGFVHEFYRVAL